MRYLLFFILFVSFTAIRAQVEFRSGSVKLDTDLRTINVDAKLDFGKFKVAMGGTYNIPERRIEHLHAEVKMEPAEIYLALEISRITTKPLDDVLKVYQVHKSKGWGYIAKEMGIKPGSAEFHEMKATVSKKAGKSKKPHKKGKGKKKK